jgi:parallel beta-helix repeat protein
LIQSLRKGVELLRKPASIIILSLLVVSALALAFNVQPVKSDYTWTEPIYIMADGSIQPPTAPISSVDGVTYTLTDNIMGKVTTYSSAIIIQRDNITIDGARYMLQGTRAIESIGIELKGRSNVTIKNMKITTFGNGITLDSSSNNSVSANNIANNGYIGIVLQSSSNSTIYHNDFMNNSAHQAYSYNSTNVWDDGYPSGGNYWSDYNGTDIMYGPNQNMTGSDGMGDTAYVIDANKRDCYPLTHPWAPPDIAILSTWSSYYGQITTHSGIVSINVNVKNNGKKAEASNLQVYANNSVIGSQPLFLLPQSTRSQNFTWNTAGYCGQYQISAYAQPLPEELNTSNNRFVDGSVTVSGKGYFILVAGNCYGSLLAAINYGCNQVYKILRSVGYGPDDILYMNQQSIGPQDVDGDGINDIDCWSSSANLQWAIETWARSRVSPSQPLFIYLFDHGGSDLFCINEPDEVSSYQLASWLDYLQNATGASVHVIYAACHSGSFINELSKSGRVIVTSCAPAEFSKTGPDGNWEVFSIPFWNQVKSGHSVLSSFNYAYSAVAPKWFWQYWWPF